MSVSAGCCDDCNGAGPYRSSHYTDALGDVHANPVAAASGRQAAPTISKADREAYERGVTMTDVPVRGGSGPIDGETIAIYSHVAVPMRDGTVLYADLYRPAAPGRYPTLISRTPYNHEQMKSDHLRFAQQGFAYLEM